MQAVHNRLEPKDIEDILVQIYKKSLQDDTLQAQELIQEMVYQLQALQTCSK